MPQAFKVRKPRLRLLTAVALSLAGLPSPAAAEDGAQASVPEDSDAGKSPGVRLSGRVAAGFEVDEVDNGRSVHDAKVELKTKRRRGSRGVVVLENDGDDDRIRLQEGYLDSKVGGDTAVLFGQTKKRLGLSYEYGDRRRMTVRRAPIYRKLEEFAFVGDEMLLKVGRDSDLGGAEPGWSAALGYAESLDINTHAAYWRPLGGDWHAGAWGLLQSDRIDGGRQLVYALVTSLWLYSGDHRAEAEVIGGKDPFESEFERTFGESRNVHFLGARAAYSCRFALGEGAALEPLAETGWTMHDIAAPRYTTHQALAGLNLWLDEDLRLALNVEALGTTSRIKPKTRTWNDSNARFEATYYF